MSTTDEARNIFEEEAIDRLGAVVDELGGTRVLLLTDPPRRHLDRALAALGDRPTAVFDGARVHVPTEVVDAARAALDDSGADTIVSLGGGSATGLGKALRVARPDLRFIAVPTTYAGSEQTRIWGTTSRGDKRTGRDDAVRPDRVLYDAGLSRTLPRKLTVQSLGNALAHPVSALSTGQLDEPQHTAAIRAIREVWSALLELTAEPGLLDARLGALRGAARAAQVLDFGKLGVHHKVAHRLGGRFDLGHAALHAALLPSFIDSLRTDAPEAFAAVVEGTGDRDPAGSLFDVLTRAGAQTGLAEMGVAWDEARAAMSDDDAIPPAAMGWAERAWVGDRPSARHRREDWGLSRPVVLAGPPLAQARRVVVSLHGRGRGAGKAARNAEELVGHAPDVAVVAPQAPGNAWYPESYRASLAAHGADLTDALETVEGTLRHVLAEVGSAEKVAIFGFSQGACLAVEAVARTPRPYAGLVALIGARPGGRDEQPDVPGSLEGVPVLLGIPEGDAWVDVDDVRATGAALRKAGAEVEVLVEHPGPHAPTLLQRVRGRALLAGIPTSSGKRGFGAHESEALPGALPPRQNSPRHAPYGLYPEQVNTTGFAAPREINQRAWTYRVRPTAQTTRYEPLSHETFVADFVDAPPEPNLAGWSPVPLPDAPTDFVDGMITFGGAGSPRLRRGYAVHLFAANRSMNDRLFSDADGELLLVPQEGRLTLVTDLGVLDVAPGEIATIPKGMRFSVLLPDGVARGYVAEIFARRFVPPERGPVGANGLTDERHFRVPDAWFEDRLTPGYRVTTKHGGSLFETTQDHSPWDVAAWHGNWVPMVYDLMDFGPAGFTRFDHVDPSVYTVLSAPLDEHGADAIDFVVFPPRWDPTEGTFRPPYFHRNVTTELNGIIREPTNPGSPFEAGMTFLTPSMTPHGVVGRSVERAFAMTSETADRPHRSHEASLWFQFESALPISLTRWARQGPARIDGWHRVWGWYRTHFDPDGGA